jgi:hypothetical protein
MRYDARHISARPVEAGNEPKLDRVDADIENNRNRRGRRLGRKCRGGAADRFPSLATLIEVGPTLRGVSPKNRW